MKKIVGLILTSLLLPLLVGAASTVAFEGDGPGQSGVPGWRLAEKDEIVTKTTRPSPDALPNFKGPPDHSNAGGNNTDDSDDSDDGDTTRSLGSELEGEAYAIVIGIANYPGTDYDLKYTDEDAEQVKDVLIKKYGYATSNVDTLIDKNDNHDDVANTDTPTEATIHNVTTTIEDVVEKADSEDEITFFFSGHGGSDDEDPDGDEEEMTDESIILHNGEEIVHLWDGELEELFDDASTSRIYFGFDSCLAGGMDDVIKDGNVFTAAANESSSAYEFDSMENGQFTHYFFEEGMHNNQADGGIGSTTQVTVEEAYNYTDESYHSRYKKDGPVMDDRFPSDSDNDNDLLLNYQK